MRQIRRGLALVLTAVLCLGVLSGCSGSKNFGTVGALKITESEYMYILRSLVSSTFGTTDLSQFQELGLDVSSTLNDLKDAAFDQCVHLKLVELKFDELGLTIDDEDKQTVDSIINYYKEQVGGASAFKSLLQEMGLTTEQYEDMLYSTVKSSKIMNTLYGEGGSEAITEEEELQYFTENYVRVKHVLLLTIDESTGESLDDETVAKAKANADDILARAQAGEDFDAMVEEYSEDPGKTAYPDGYIFDQYASYVQEFLDTSFSLNVGEVGSCESSYGYHVIKRYPLDEDAHFSNYKDEVLSRISETRLDALLDELKEQTEIVKGSAIDEITLENLK